MFLKSVSIKMISDYLQRLYIAHANRVLQIECFKPVVGLPTDIVAKEYVGLLVNPTVINRVRCAVKRDSGLQSQAWIGPQEVIQLDGQFLYKSGILGLIELDQPDGYYLDFVGFVLGKLRPWVPNFLLTLGRTSIRGGPIEGNIFIPWQDDSIREMVVVEAPTRWLSLRDLLSGRGWEQILRSRSVQDIIAGISLSSLIESLILQLLAAFYITHHQLRFYYNGSLLDNLFVMEGTSQEIDYSYIKVWGELLLIVGGYQHASFTYQCVRYTRGEELPFLVPLLDFFWEITLIQPDPEMSSINDTIGEIVDIMVDIANTFVGEDFPAAVLLTDDPRNIPLNVKLDFLKQYAANRHTLLEHVLKYYQERLSDISH